jgi:hypothetical protein
MGMPPEMGIQPKMRMAPETMGTSSPTPMKKGGMAKKGNNDPAKTPSMNMGGMAKTPMMKKGGMAKGGMPKPGKGKGMAVVIMIGKGKSKKG